MGFSIVSRNQRPPGLGGASGLALAALLLLALPATAQIQLARSVFGNAGTATSGPSNQVTGTLGQAVVGVASGSNYRHEIGFWVGLPVSTAVEEIVGLPEHYALQQNHPNPFRPTTTIRYAVPEAVRVVIRLYDIRGREVATLIDAEHQPGWHEVGFRALGLVSGIYFYRMEAGRFGQSRKMVLLEVGGP